MIKNLFIWVMMKIFGCVKILVWYQGVLIEQVLDYCEEINNLGVIFGLCM